MNITVIDAFLPDPDAHVSEILATPFTNFTDGRSTFRNIQARGIDAAYGRVMQQFPDYDAQYHFVRKSPHKQPEPNMVHHDGMMGDLTVIIYLNKTHPETEGTSFYEHTRHGMYGHGDTFEGPFTKVAEVRMKYNRMLAFPSSLYHSRNHEDNFGQGDDSRLIEVFFLKKK